MSDYYGAELLNDIVLRSGGILNLDVSEDGANEVASRSRGTPRIANRLLRRARDFAEVEGDGTIGLAVARAALEVFDVDELGLDRLDGRGRGAEVAGIGEGPGERGVRGTERAGEGPGGPPPSRRRCLRSPTRPRTPSSPSCSAVGCCNAPPVAGSPRSGLTRIWDARSPPRARSCQHEGRGRSRCLRTHWTTDV